MSRWTLPLAAVLLLGCDAGSPPPKSMTGAAGTTGVAGTTGAAGHDGGAAGTGEPDSGPPTEAPAAFGLKLPMSGDPTVLTPATFSWERAAGAETYVVEIATKATFGDDDVVKKAGVAATTYTVTAADGLLPGVIYFWRATAVNALGSTPASNAPFTFTSPVAAGPNPHGVAVTPDGKTAVVSNDKAPGSLTLLDLAAFSTQTIALPGRPGMVAVTPDGTRVLAAEGSPTDVVIVDLATKAITGKVTSPCVATTLYGLAIKPDGSAVVIPDLAASCTKDVLDVAALPGGAITKTIDLATTAGSFGVALTPDGAFALVTHGVLGTSIKRVDLAAGALTTITDTSSSYGVAVTADGKEALVASGPGEPIKRVSLATNAVTGSITFGSNQDVGNIAVTPGGQVAVVVGDFAVGVLTLADGKVAAKYELAGRSVAITPDGARALVTGAGATGQVYVIGLPDPSP
jgi:hypothetical protein